MQQYKSDLSLAKYLFHQGKNYEAYEYFGSHFGLRDGKEGFIFRVWAPNAASVSVVGDFNGWDHLADPMEQEEEGGISVSYTHLTLPTMAVV